jgi:hypothetical protein
VNSGELEEGSFFIFKGGFISYFPGDGDISAVDNTLGILGG